MKNITCFLFFPLFYFDLAERLCRAEVVDSEVFGPVEPPGLMTQPGGGPCFGPGGTVVPGGGAMVVEEGKMTFTCPGTPQVQRGIVEGSHQMGGV